ncbi:hypothetical protein R1C85_07820 [Escherichia coli]|nr:hypothetical protein [Escherichia coli]MCV8762605.1 hypothetical protein [Escherichia coli]MDI1000517.1 hypothetical protein [Escherichia coli]MDI1078447.1 hypothetical protein [Escherichia coli]
MTYMKLTAAKRIVFFIYLFVIQFSNESQLKNLPGYNEGRAGK